MKIGLFLVYIGLSRGQSLQQTSTPALIQQEITVPQLPSFSKHLNDEQLALWLQNHPSLAGTDYQEDISKLIKGTLPHCVRLHIKPLTYH